MRLCQYSSARYCNNGDRATVTATTKVAAIAGNIVSLGCYTPTGSGRIYRGMPGNTGYHAGNGSICAARISEHKEYAKKSVQYLKWSDARKKC